MKVLWGLTEFVFYTYNSFIKGTKNVPTFESKHFSKEINLLISEFTKDSTILVIFRHTSSRGPPKQKKILNDQHLMILQGDLKVQLIGQCSWYLKMLFTILLKIK